MQKPVICYVAVVLDSKLRGGRVWRICGLRPKLYDPMLEDYLTCGPGRMFARCGQK